MRTLWIAGLVLGTMLCSGAVRADESTRFRLQDELDLTDRRIEVASSLLAEAASPPPEATLELTRAKTLQSDARGAYASNMPLIAMRATQEAREHADRAIAIVRGLPDPGRVQDQVERTHDILDRARDRLQGCSDTRARAMLKVAIEMQQRAEDRLRESRYLGALQLTMSARERVLKAMQLCNVDESIVDAADRALQRTTEMLSRAQDALDADSPPAMRDALARAQVLQAQALAEAQLGHHEAALRLTQRARALVQWAVRGGRGARGRAR